MMRAILVVLVSVSLYAAEDLLDGSGLHPTPDAAELKQAEASVHSLFKAEYASRDPASRLALADKLLQQGLAEKGATTLAFVLLRDARDLAASSGAVATALAAHEALTTLFSGQEDVLQVVGRCERATKDAAGLTLLAKTVQRLAGQAALSGDFDLALKALSKAGALAAAAKQPVLGNAVRQGTEVVKFVQKSLRAAQAAQKKLSDAPADPEAHEALGRHLCFVFRDWNAGLEHLAAGKDPLLAAIARDELAKPTGTALAVIGDRWLEAAARSAQATARQAITDHALALFRAAAETTTGIEQLAVAKRITDLNAADRKAIGAAVYALSAGYEAGNTCAIVINGQRLIPSPRRGLSVVAVNDDLQPVLVETYDTYERVSECRRLLDDLRLLPVGTLVVAVVMDEATQSWNQDGQQALALIGATVGLQGQPWRSSYLAVGFIGSRLVSEEVAGKSQLTFGTPARTNR